MRSRSIGSVRFWRSLVAGALTLVALATGALVLATAASAAAGITSFAPSPGALPWQGGAVTLTATVTDSATCKFTATPAVTGLPANVACTTGTVTQSVVLPANTTLTGKTYTFKLTASRPGGGSVTSTTTVLVAAEPAPTVQSFSATPATLTYLGGPVDVEATVADATTCTLAVTPALSGLPATVDCTSAGVSQGLTLPANTSLTSKTYTFKLTASRTGGGSATSTRTAVVAPEPAPSIPSFTALPVTVGHLGGPVDLEATVFDASTCKFTVTPAVSGLPAIVDCTSTGASQSVALPANTSLTRKTYTFKLAASRNGGGTTTSTQVVSVDPEPGPSIASFTATPAFLPPAGGAVHLDAGVADAISCRFSSSPAVTGLPLVVPCASGPASANVTLPANTGATARTYTVTLTAIRAGATSATLTRTVIVSTPSARTDLAILQTDSPDPVVTGNAVTYTLSVQNNGPSQATEVTAVDTLPDGTALAGANPSQGTCDNATGSVSCDLGVLAANAVASVDITVQVAAAGTISNSATVTGNETDPDATNNSATEQTVVNDPITITSGPAEGSTLRDNGALFQFTLSGASSATCQLDNFPSSPCSSSFSTADATYRTGFGRLGNNLGSGPHRLTISAFGSSGFRQVVRHFTVPVQPLLSSNPASGPAFAQFTNYNALSGLYPTGYSTYYARAVVSENADGSMLILGQYGKTLFNSISSTTQEQGFVLMKVKADLTLDPSFGTGGFVQVQAPGQASFQSPELITAAGGYIYTVTYGGSSDGRILRRYDLTGARDTSFGDVSLSLPPSMQAAYDYRYSSHLEIDDQGNVLIGGSMNPTNDFNNWRGMLIRVTSAGAQDTSFGDGGVVAIDAIRSPGCSSNADFDRYSVNDIVELPDNGYLVTGGDQVACYRAMATYKIDSAGAIDTSFGVGGATASISTFGFASALRIDLVDGGTKFMLVGGGLNSTFFARFNVDGTADTTFNNGSDVKELWGYPLGFAATGVARDAATGDYSFLGSGSAPWSPINGQYAIARANANGDPDTGFDSDGVLPITPARLPEGAFVDVPNPGDGFFGVYANSSDVLALGYQYAGNTNSSQGVVRRFTTAGGIERG